MTFARIRSFVSWLPWVALAAFYCDVVFTRLWFGRWPTYGHPDAGALHGLPLAIHRLVFVVLGVGSLSPILFLDLFAIALIQGRRPRGAAMRCALGWIVLVASVKFDPGRFYDWFFD